MLFDLFIYLYTLLQVVIKLFMAYPRMFMQILFLVIGLSILGGLSSSISTFDFPNVSDPTTKEKIADKLHTKSQIVQLVLGSLFLVSAFTLNTLSVQKMTLRLHTMSAANNVMLLSLIALLGFTVAAIYFIQDNFSERYKTVGEAMRASLTIFGYGVFLLVFVAYMYKLFTGDMQAPTGSTYSWSSFFIGFFLVIFALFKKGSFEQLKLTRILNSLSSTFSGDESEDTQALQAAGTTPMVADTQLAAGVFMMVYGLCSSAGGTQLKFQKIHSLIPVDRNGKYLEKSYRSISLFKIYPSNENFASLQTILTQKVKSIKNRSYLWTITWWLAITCMLGACVFYLATYLRNMDGNAYAFDPIAVPMVRRRILSQLILLAIVFSMSAVNLIMLIQHRSEFRLYYAKHADKLGLKA